MKIDPIRHVRLAIKVLLAPEPLHVRAELPNLVANPHQLHGQGVASPIGAAKASRHRVVIVGGGFGGLQAALALRHEPVQVTLIDKRNFHLFQPLLYQVATGSLSPANIAAPLRSLVRKQSNARVILEEAVGVDPVQRVLHLAGGSIAYDTLVIAAGSRPCHAGHAEWERIAPGLKTVEDAIAMRRRVFAACEAAERTDDLSERSALLTFLVVGGGPTGVELAGALAEIVRHTLAREFRRIGEVDARILLIESGPRLLTAFAPVSSQQAAIALAKLGVTVRTATAIREMDAQSALLASGGAEERVATRTILWAAGVRGAAFGGVLAAATGAVLDGAGRVPVGPDCAVAGHPTILVIGDLARMPGEGALPGVAPVAMQQGAYAARLICARLRGTTIPAFAYRDSGQLATIGRLMAVGRIGSWRVSGAIAWFVWLLTHLLALVRFESRLLVLMQWAWHYATWNRSARLITLRDQDG